MLGAGGTREAETRFAGGGRPFPRSAAGNPARRTIIPTRKAPNPRRSWAVPFWAREPRSSAPGYADTSTTFRRPRNTSTAADTGRPANAATAAA